MQSVLAPAEGGGKAKAAKPPRSLSFARTAKRSYEKAYWNLISELATGQYVNKDNADCVRDPATQAKLTHEQRDLEALGDYVLNYYVRLVADKKMSADVLVGELPFRWQTEFPFPWMGGWLQNQDRKTYERDLMVVIPGRDRSRAVIMADHYDTAYMEDTFGYAHGGHGPRLSAAGADDNHSATAALMLGAESFLELSRAGKLGCDVWLVHLTGEEFPSDCMGARFLAQQVVQGTLALHLGNDRCHDLSQTRIQGVYVLDMVAHNNDRDRDVFQICPGSSRESMWLAYQAHKATQTWNALAPSWNERPERRGRGRGHRSADGTLPEVALPSASVRRSPSALRSAQHALQHRRADLFRRRHPRRAVHGELRHQSPRLSRYARHDGEHRPGLRRGRVGNCHRVGRPGRDRNTAGRVNARQGWPAAWAIAAGRAATA